jgi:hypothetical protein
MERGSPDADWARRLAVVIAAAVRELSTRLRGTPVIQLAVDCHPWNGTLGLSVLTAAEVEADPVLNDPSEMAAWRHFNCSAGLAAWQPAGTFGREMQTAYTTAADRKAAADEFFRACATAVSSPEVGTAVALLDTDSRFRVSVAHPDDGREYCRRRV